jgi:hypothetical protein
LILRLTGETIFDQLTINVMKLIMRLCAICVIVSSASCTKDHVKGSGSVVTEQRNLSGFTSISSSGSSKVYVSRGSQFSVEVRGYANLLPYFETKVLNNELRLGYKDNVSVKNDNTEIYVTLPLLDGLRLSGSGDIRTSGDFPLVANFNSSISGSGNIYYSDGSAGFCTLSISGSGNMNMIGLKADKAETTTSGSGNTEISVATHLKVKISGSGNVYYRGNPIIVTNISGSGDVIPK